VEVYEPLPASTVRLPLTLVRGRLLEPQAVQNVRLRFLSGQQVPLQLDPNTGEFTELVPFAQQPGRLRLIVEAQEVTSGNRVLNSWVVECVEAPMQDAQAQEPAPLPALEPELASGAGLEQRPGPISVSAPTAAPDAEVKRE
jgi:hypothetical protein